MNAAHCRIVTYYVGGGKSQVKIINYPDRSEHIKVYTNNNNNNQSSRTQKRQ